MVSAAKLLLKGHGSRRGLSFFNSISRIKNEGCRVSFELGDLFTYLELGKAGNIVDF